MSTPPATSTLRAGATIEVGARDFRTNLATLLDEAGAGTPIIVTRRDGTRLRLGLERELETPLERAVREGRARLGVPIEPGWDGKPAFAGRSRIPDKHGIDYIREDRA